MEQKRTQRRKLPPTKKVQRGNENLTNVLKRKNYQYRVTPEVYSEIKCRLHKLSLNAELPGRDALKEVLTFLKTFKDGNEKERLYRVALKSALYKVQGRKFVNSNEERGIIKSEEDVVQVIKESLATARISYDELEEFIYSLIN